MKDTITFLLSSENDRKYFLDVVSSKEDTFIDFVLRNDDKVLSSLSYDNISMQLINSEPAIDTVDFGNDNATEYVFYSYVIGSTYGAEVNIIVYYDANGWELVRIPFERCRVSYVGELNDYAITSYESDGDSTLYQFNRGAFFTCR